MTIDLFVSLTSLTVSGYTLWLVTNNKKKHRKAQSRPAIKHPETDLKPYVKKTSKLKPKVNDDLAGWKQENGIL